MNILVTGGAGYVGSALVPRLADAGHDVRVLDDFALSSPRNLMGADVQRYEFVRGDVRDPDVVERAVEDVDAVVHLAAVTGAAQSHEVRDRVMDVNVGGTETVVSAAEDAGVDRLVLASSCNVYGDAYDEELTEESEPAPGNPYAESKLRAESLCADSDVESVALRLATNFGYSPGVRFNLVVNDFTFRALTGDPLTVYGDGTNWRPYLHVRDTARAFAAALDWPTGVYNVGHDNVRVQTVAETVADEVGRAVDVTYLGDRDPGPSYHVDFRRMRKVGFEPTLSLRDGIADLASQFTAEVAA
ncbi:NAD-dependent epimerase/dehydratase family protein [Halobaculum sp. P14]|uniref:NAD-dependent epimerase/dehydratase family protein n=1 Tax=Halobaculum sp. P14 TaxID=3421638 RepID=UPI003EB9AD0A